MVLTTYQIHVKGQIRGMVSDEFIKTYVMNTEPKTLTEAKRFVSTDFQSIKAIHVEEVTVSKRLMKFDDANLPAVEPMNVMGEDDDNSDE